MPLRTRLLWACALLLLALPACAQKARAQGTAAPASQPTSEAKRAPGSEPNGVGFHTLRGRVAFEAAFEMPGERPIPPESEIPEGHTGVHQLRVCLYEQHGRNDIATEGAIANDVEVGCRDTDREGNFEIPISKAHCRRAGDCSRRYYLMTRLCSWSAGRPQVCVTANTAQEKDLRRKPLTKWVEYRKLLWSETYRISLTDRTSNLVSWNLSCPAEDGYGRPDLSCERPGRGGRWDRKHSNYGHTKESVHAFYGAAQSLIKMGTFTPTTRNSLSPRGAYCGGPQDPEDDNWQCQDAVRIVVRDMRTLGMEGDRHCARRIRAKHPNWFYPQRAVCLGSPFQPFAVTHELGHVIMARWMGYRGAMNDGEVGWANGSSQKSQVGEGWADFFATFSWYAADAQNPAASGWAMEDAGARRRFCVNGVAQGELHAAQFFWDLFDPANPNEPEDDVELDFWAILQVWSLFRGKRDGFEERDRTPGECDPHGRNIKDYLHYYREFPNRPLPPADGLVRHNCLTKHVDTIQCR